MNKETDEQYYFAQDYIVINGKAKILKAQPEHSAIGMNLPSTCLWIYISLWTLQNGYFTQFHGVQKDMNNDNRSSN